MSVLSYLQAVIALLPLLVHGACGASARAPPPVYQVRHASTPTGKQWSALREAHVTPVLPPCPQRMSFRRNMDSSCPSHAALRPHGLEGSWPGRHGSALARPTASAWQLQGRAHQGACGLRVPREPTAPTIAPVAAERRGATLDLPHSQPHSPLLHCLISQKANGFVLSPFENESVIYLHCHTSHLAAIY